MLAGRLEDLLILHLAVDAICAERLFLTKRLRVHRPAWPALGHYQWLAVCGGWFWDLCGGERRACWDVLDRWGLVFEAALKLINHVLGGDLHLDLPARLVIVEILIVNAVELLKGQRQFFLGSFYLDDEAGGRLGSLLLLNELGTVPVKLALFLHAARTVHRLDPLRADEVVARRHVRRHEDLVDL